MSTTTPKIAYHIGQDAQTLRLLSHRNATTCCAYLLPALSALPPTFKLLDVGCGPASITFSLAVLFPLATIIGMDQSASVIALNQTQAKERNTSGPATEFRVGDILHPNTFLDDSELGTFDVVHVHASLINIPTPVSALQQMRRIAKPGGIIAARDGDLKSQILYPPCDTYTAFIHALYARDKTDIETGRKLISLAMEAGWERDQIEASASVLSTITKEDRGDFSGSMIRNLGDGESEMRRSAEDIGFGGKGIEAICEDLERFRSAEAGWRIIICGEIICRNE